MPENKLPPDVIRQWPEVLKDVDVKVVPIEYLDSIRVFFEDGKIWDIDVQKSRQKDKELDIESIIEGMFAEYDDHIVNVDFRLDASKMKRDVERRTKSFLKKNK